MTGLGFWVVFFKIKDRSLIFVMISLDINVYFSTYYRSKPDPTWYAGKGSVKNLVNVYQEQVEDVR